MGPELLGLMVYPKAKLSAEMVRDEGHRPGLHQRRLWGWAAHCQGPLLPPGQRSRSVARRDTRPPVLGTPLRKGLGTAGQCVCAQDGLSLPGEQDTRSCSARGSWAGTSQLLAPQPVCLLSQLLRLSGPRPCQQAPIRDLQSRTPQGWLSATAARPWGSHRRDDVCCSLRVRSSLG